MIIPWFLAQFTCWPHSCRAVCHHHNFANMLCLYTTRHQLIFHMWSVIGIYIMSEFTGTSSTQTQTDTAKFYWIKTDIRTISGLHKVHEYTNNHSHGLVQDYSNPIANALDLLQFCTKQDTHNEPYARRETSTEVIPDGWHGGHPERKASTAMMENAMQLGVNWIEKNIWTRAQNQNK